MHDATPTIDFHGHGGYVPFLQSVPLLIVVDYAVFASDDFDANDYANAVLAGEQYDTVKASATVKVVTPEPSAKEEISIAISKLTVGVDDVSKQIKTLVRPTFHLPRRLND